MPLIKSIFVWAWYAVNTRCITLNTDSNNPSWALKSPKIALAPFLDCLNHSETCQIHAYLDDSGYIIRTRTDFDKNIQVFINYGPHDNNFLLSEYGFCIPNNRYTHVVLDNQVQSLLEDSLPEIRQTLVFEGLSE